MEKGQEFLIVHISRQKIESGVATIDTTALVEIGENLKVNGNNYKPIASITRSEGGHFASGHFTFQCRRGTLDKHWYQIDDNLKPKRILEPRNGFLYLFMLDDTELLGYL